MMMASGPEGTVTKSNDHHDFDWHMFLGILSCICLQTAGTSLTLIRLPIMGCQHSCCKDERIVPFSYFAV